MKKMLAMVLAVVLVMACGVTALAATDINENEQKILDAVGKAVTVDGKTVEIPADLQNEVETYLMRDGVDLTAEQAATIVEKVDACFDIAVENGVTSTEALKNLPYEVKNQLLTLAQEGAAVVDLNVAYDSASGSLVVTDADNNTVAKVEPALKVTGADSTVLVLVAAAVVVLLVGGVIVAKKNKLFAK